jgi:hypothetical protein
MKREGRVSALVSELRSLISRRSDLTQSQAAEILQVSRARISQLAKENNLLFRDGRAAYRHRLRVPPAAPRAAPPIAAADASAPGIEDADERVVAADLLQRDFVVYRAMTQASAFEIVAHKDGRLVRIKVCHAGEPIARQALGDVAESTPCDVLATVNPDGSVAYWPGRGVEWCTSRLPGHSS